MAPTRLQRSALYLPAINQRALTKAEQLAVDTLILDLEDAVAPDSKLEARENACAALTSGRYGGREVIVRINASETEWHNEDLSTISQANPAGVLIPKVNSATEIIQVAQALDAADAPTDLEIWAMIETPLGVLRAMEIAGAHPRLTTLVMGTNDLAKELRVHSGPGRTALLTSLSLCLLASRAMGKSILDGVYNNIQDGVGFEAECRQSRGLGFDGKTLIHPRQIEPCNRLFSPSPEEIHDAQQIVTAFAQAEATGRAVATVEGKMIERMHWEEARRILTLSEVINSLS